MPEKLDHQNLHRTAKYFMDSGRADSADEALAILQGFGLNIVLAPGLTRRRDCQIAVLTLVTLARRTLLGGVNVVILEDAPLAAPLAAAATFSAAVLELGGKVAQQTHCDWPDATIGAVPHREGAPAHWRLGWQGWRGLVTPARIDPSMDDAALPIAPAVAAAACVSEAFAFFTGDHPMAGKRCAGLSLWQPGAAVLEDDASEPKLTFLPSRLWLVGLGNLGQAYAWLLACLPYREPREFEVVLQDFDELAASNDSTSVLSSLAAIGIKKTRWVAAWLERAGFETRICERRFSSSSRRAPDEPAVALFGVDNALARVAIEDAGFELVIEAGLGAGVNAFRNLSLHTFPGRLKARDLWRDTGSAAPSVADLPAYERMRADGLEECGLIQMASRTIGVPFVGLLAGALVIAEVLRRLHGAPGLEVLSASATNLDDIECVTSPSEPYSLGHLEI